MSRLLQFYYLSAEHTYSKGNHIESLFCDFMCTISIHIHYSYRYLLIHILCYVTNQFDFKFVFEYVLFLFYSNKNVLYWRAQSNWVTKTISKQNIVWCSLYGDNSVGKSNMFGLKYLRKFSSCNLTPKSSGPYCKPRQAARN